MQWMLDVVRKDITIILPGCSPMAANTVMNSHARPRNYF